jgi:hypothetical protein
MRRYAYGGECTDMVHAEADWKSGQCVADIARALEKGTIRPVSDEGEEGLSEKVNAASAALVDRGLRAQDALGKSCTH